MVLEKLDRPVDFRLREPRRTLPGGEGGETHAQPSCLRMIRSAPAALAHTAPSPPPRAAEPEPIRYMGPLLQLRAAAGVR